MFRWLAICFVLAGSVMAAGQTPPKSVPKAEAVLRAALAAERRSHAYCEAVIAKFGPRAPFAQVVEGEGLHAAIVEELMIRRNIQVPPNPFDRKPNETKAAFAARMKVPATYPQALRAAVRMEERQGPVYRTLIASAPEGMKPALTKLRREALNRHLPVFKGSIRRAR
jgi:hypothetical protein